MSRALTQVKPPPRADQTMRLQRTWRLLRIVAWTGAFLTFLVVLFAAAMRLQSAGVRCTPWPECRELARPTSGIGPLVRAGHRIAAMSVSACVLAIVVLAAGPAAGGRLPRKRSLLALACVAGLAALGRASGATATAVVQLGNLLGGFVLTGLLVSVALDGFTEDRAASARRAMAEVWFVVLVLVTGALSSILFVDQPCSPGAACATPMVPSALESPTKWMHRAIPVLLGGWLAIGWWSRRGVPRLSVGVLWVIQCAVGVWQSSGEIRLAGALAHNGLSLVLLAGALWIAATERDQPAGAVWISRGKS